MIIPTKWIKHLAAEVLGYERGLNTENTGEHSV